jgi:hypothetical protein
MVAVEIIQVKGDLAIRPQEQSEIRRIDGNWALCPAARKPSTAIVANRCGDGVDLKKSRNPTAAPSLEKCNISELQKANV